MLAALLRRACWLVAGVWVLIVAPSPVSSLSLPFKNGLVTIVAVAVAGKLLYDTLFFDRFRP